MNENGASPDIRMSVSKRTTVRWYSASVKDWAETMDKLRLPYSLHALRHTHASALIAGGMDVESVSRRLGHSSAVITLRVYSHLFSNTDDRAAEIMGAVFSRLRTD